MRRITLILFMAVTAFGVYANGTAEGETEKVTFTIEEVTHEPTRVVTVDPSGEILAIFESYGIDSSRLDDTVCETREIQSELALILTENRDNVVDLINAELQDHLRRDGTEEAYMTIGSYFFTASRDYPVA